MGVIERLAPLGRWLWPLAIANLLANIGIVVTGAAVRLTGSGLGCPTWPRCSEESYVAHEELGINGVIEFGNRLLTFVLAAAAILCFLAAVAANEKRPGMNPTSPDSPSLRPLPVHPWSTTGNEDRLIPIWGRPRHIQAAAGVLFISAPSRRRRAPARPSRPPERD